ncbi:hypothetical protein pb186bvf_000926 [Paramecium bursaria]
MHIIHHSYKLLLKLTRLYMGAMTVSGLTNFSVPKNLFLKKKLSPRYDQIKTNKNIWQLQILKAQNDHSVIENFNIYKGKPLIYIGIINIFLRIIISLQQPILRITNHNSLSHIIIDYIHLDLCLNNNKVYNQTHTNFKKLFDILYLKITQLFIANKLFEEIQGIIVQKLEFQKKEYYIDIWEKTDLIVVNPAYDKPMTRETPTSPTIILQ